MGSKLETDVCIVGAGPAGLALAAELNGHGLDVLVLESGAEPTAPSVLALNQGSVHGDPYVGLGETRHRGLGGTTGIWNTAVHGVTSAKCVPLDPVDFEIRTDRELSGWPFGADELDPAYERALELCGLKTASFEASAWTSEDRRPLPDLPAPLVSRVYQMTTKDFLLRSTLATLREAAGVRIRSDATVFEIRTGAGRERVTSVLFGTPGETGRHEVVGRHFVLAAGAVENARLLLHSDLGNESDWVGRCFMEHPRDTSIRLRPRSEGFYREAAFYDLHDGPDGTPVLGRLALEGAALADGYLPNASGTLLPRVRPRVYSVRRVLGPLARRADRLLPRGGHGWSSHPSPGLVFEGMTLLLNLEQAPHPENRIRLSRDVDSMGVPRAELHWRWRDVDQARLVHLRRIAADALGASGRVEVDVDENARVDPNAHHHAGTTRMHDDTRQGVVDAAGRVHGLDNLFVAGASVMPTAGFANPLLTILALSVRLGRHLVRIV